MPTTSTNPTLLSVFDRVPKDLVLKLCYFSDIVYEAATISGKAYQQTIEYTLPEGWTILANSRAQAVTSAHNYCGMLFLNREEHKAVIAHGGSDPLNIHDMSDGIKLFNHDMPDKIPVMKRFIKAISKDIPNEYEIYITGHSAGGVMSDLTALEYEQMGRHNVSFSFTFDNPGSAPFAQKLYSPEIISQTLSHTQMIALQARPNFFNTIAPHLAEKYFLFFSHRSSHADGLEDMPYKYDLHAEPDTRSIMQRVVDTACNVPYSKLSTLVFGACKVLSNSTVSTLDVISSAQKAVMHSGGLLQSKAAKYILEHTQSSLSTLFKVSYGTDEVQKLLPHFIDINALRDSKKYIESFQDKWSSYSATATQLLFRLGHVGDHPLTEFIETLRHKEPVLYHIHSGYGYGPTHKTVTVSSPPRVSAQLRARAGTEDSASSQSVDDEVQAASSVLARVMQTPQLVVDSLTGSQYGATPVMMRSRSNSVYEENLDGAAKLFVDTKQGDLLNASVEMPSPRSEVVSPGNCSISPCDKSLLSVRDTFTHCVKEVILTKNMVLMLLTLRAMKSCAAQHLVHPSISMDDLREVLIEKASEAELAAQKAKDHCSEVVHTLEDTMCDAAGRAKQTCADTVEHYYQMAADCRDWLAAQMDGSGGDAEWVEVAGAHDAE